MFCQIYAFRAHLLTLYFYAKVKERRYYPVLRRINTFSVNMTDTWCYSKLEMYLTVTLVFTILQFQQRRAQRNISLPAAIFVWLKKICCYLLLVKNLLYCAIHRLFIVLDVHKSIYGFWKYFPNGFYSSFSKTVTNVTIVMTQEAQTGPNIMAVYTSNIHVTARRQKTDI